MEVAAGPMFELKDHVGLPVFLHGEKEKKVEELVLAAGRRSSGFCFVEQEEDVSSESSSIGAESSSSSEEDDRKDAGDEEVQSKLTEGPLGSLDSLEESLPIKRGLSNFFTGKSKSFASLSDVANAGAGELAKTENPFNKRRRILKAYSKPSWAARRASYISLLPRLTPLTVVEGDGDEDDDDDDDAAAASAGGESLLPPLPHRHHHHHGRDESNLKRAFRSPRSFSLSDLQHA